MSIAPEKSKCYSQCRGRELEGEIPSGRCDPPAPLDERRPRPVRSWRAPGRTTRARYPPVVVGDFNAEPESTEIRFLTGLARLAGRSTYFQDAWRVAGDGGPGATWDNRNPYAALGCEPTRRIDYVFVGAAREGRGLAKRAHFVLDEPDGEVFASDHFGVAADFRT